MVTRADSLIGGLAGLPVRMLVATFIVAALVMLAAALDRGGRQL